MSSSMMEMKARVDVLVHEEIKDTTGDSLWFVQRADGKFAVVRWGFSPSPDAPDALAALERVRWFDRDLIGGALVTANVRPLVDPDSLLSFYGACAVSLGLVKHPDTKELEGAKGDLLVLRLEHERALALLDSMTPTKKEAAKARALLNQRSLLKRGNG